MSNDSSVMTDPFAPTVLDEETELRALARALNYADGFSLLFVRCHQRDQQKRLVAALRNELPPFRVLELRFDSGIDHLLDELRKELRQHLTEPPPDAVFVFGLEYSLPTAADAHATSFVANLNASRNSFPEIVPCPLVLWVPEYVLTAIMRGAPDFFSIRSGVYYFVATPEETTSFVESLTAGEYWQVANMPLKEKQERIAAIHSLLEDYRALPPAQRDRRAEARLLTRLGSFYRTLGRWDEAEAYHQQSLEIRREVGNRVGEGKTLTNLGLLYQDQGRWGEAEAHYQQSLEIKQGCGDRVGEGQTLNNLGESYRLQGRWAEAEACYRQSLEIRREAGDRVGEGRTLNNLAELREAQGNIAGGLEFARQAVAVLETTEDKSDLEKARALVARLELQAGEQGSGGAKEQRGGGDEEQGVSNQNPAK